MVKYRLGFSIQVDNKILDFESLPLEEEEANELSPYIAGMIGDNLVDKAVIVRKYVEASRSLAPLMPE